MLGEIFTLCLIVGCIQFIRLLNIMINEAKEDKLREQIITELRAKGIKIEDE